MYLACALTSLGFAAILPITIGLAQRLLPGRTGLASALMMGVAWSSGALSAPLAGAFLGGVSLNAAGSLPAHTIDMAFVWFAVLLVVGGVLALAMPKALIRQVAQHR
jgi:MFS family permease